MSTGVYAQFAGGDGSSGNPYQVATTEHLNIVRNYLTSYFIQTADINLNVAPYNTGEGWVPIGSSASRFSGSYNGNGHVVNNLYISNENSYNGLFGYISGATITDLGVVNVNISAHARSGGLAGISVSGSKINNCFSTGSVTIIDGYYNGGGLIGSAADTDISNCYSRTSVYADILVGGLVSEMNNGSLVNCYSTGSVTAENSDGLGGFLGTNYSATITDCFWDTQTSGLSVSDGGIGKTTAEMKTLATFTDESSDDLTTAWDFETNPNDDAADADIWDMDLSATINNGYPYLSWQDSEDFSLPVQLVSFTANFTDGTVLLEWETESETDNLGFILERKARNENTWTTISSYLTHDALKSPGTTQSTTVYSFADWNIKTGEHYVYRLSDVSLKGIVTVKRETEIEITNAGLPDKTALLPAYPNPFNPATKISYQLDKDAVVNLSVVDLLGRTVNQLITDMSQSAGTYTVSWTGLDAGHKPCPAGMYLLIFRAGDLYSSRKVTLVR